MIPPGLRAWRKAKLAHRYPDGKISEHFRHQEFWTHDGTPIPASDANLLGLRRHARLILEPMRDHFGPCHVVSGYRHRAYNAAIGGARNSHHIWDEHRSTPATDLIFVHGDAEAWGDHAARLCARNGIGGGIGKYRRLGFVHIDLRPDAARWRGSGE